MSRHPEKRGTIPAAVRVILPAVFWIGVWWALSAIVNREVLIPSPPAVFLHLLSLLRTADFYLSVMFSVLRVTAGFALGLAAGCLFGALCAGNGWIDALMFPFMSVVRATPVASFIILALVWVNRDMVPVLISAMMVMPVIFGNVREGIRKTDRGLLEMARVFQIGTRKTWTKIRIPSVLPYLFAGIKTSIGLSWKAGVAAEVLSLAALSIGKYLYQSKVYLETADMFAWTLVVILLSILIERLLTLAFRRLPSSGESMRQSSGGQEAAE